MADYSSLRETLQNRRNAIEHEMSERNARIQEANNKHQSWMMGKQEELIELKGQLKLLDQLEGISRSENASQSPIPSTS